MAIEVFLQDVPDINDRGLYNELEPLMKKLDIHDWIVEKPRSRGKTMGWIRFLDDADGVKFLAKYGVSNRQPRLTLVGSKVRAMRSRSTPDEFAVRAMRHSRDERVKKQARRGTVVPEAKAELILQHASFACGHNMFINKNLTFIQEWDTRGLNGSTRFGRRMIVIKHRDPSQTTTTRIEIPYEIVVSTTHSDSSFLLVLDQPPRFFEVQEDAKKTTRLTGLPHVSAESCLVYRLGIVGDKRDLVKTWHGISALDKFECTTFDVPVRDPMMEPLFGRIETHMSQFKHHVAGLLESQMIPFDILFQAEALVSNNYLHPRTASEFLRLLADYFVKESRRTPIPPLSGEAIKRMMQSNNIDYAWRGADPDSLEPPALLNKLIATEETLREEKMLREDFRQDQMQGKAWIMRATVTPTRITLHGPEPEAMNRILRKYSQHLDYFVRVQICEEDGEDLRFMPKVDYGPLRERFEKLLQDGIPIGGRVYGFLGFSHSSLRARSVWLQAPFLDATRSLQAYATIIRSLGDFDKIRVPAKCAARIGQAFTETPVALSLRECGIELTRISDVKTADGQRVFSDGVGVITQRAVEELWRQMPYVRKAGSTCFQIRLGSIKGMLALDSRYKEKIIMIRQESMMKFMCDDWDELGICELANKPLKMYLNRQLIKILEDMGVPNAWFIRQQRKELDMLKQVTSSTWRTKLFLERQAIATNFGFPRFLEDLEKLGIDWRQDSFIKSAVSNVVMSEVRLLKHKSRIPISKGVTLFGVMDETGFLNEGEIFVTFDTQYEGTRDYIDGNVWNKTRRRAFVTRSPALHPGDVQVVWMVRPPEHHPLRQLQNCIVFARRGARDLPSQLSGGDLDGDKYHVIWDPDAFSASPPVQPFPPADYPRVEAKELDRPVTKADIIKHFLDFMQADQLGIIATRHMILSDQRINGTRDTDCIKLAEIHSTAVDFSKSGVPVDIREMNSITRNKLRPDFLSPAPPAKLLDYGQYSFAEEEESDDEGDGPVMNYYASEKILGQLYRNVDEKKIWREDIDVKVTKGGPSIWEKLMILVNRDLKLYSDGSIKFAHKLKAAWRLRNIFDGEVASLREQYAQNYRHPLPEIDVFCGHIFNRTGTQSRRQRDTTTKLRDDTVRNTDWLIRQIRNGGEAPATTIATRTLDSMSTAGGVGLDDDDDGEYVMYNREALEIALACVMISSARDQQHFPESYTGDGKGCSFRIVAARCLIREMAALKEAWGAEHDVDEGVLVGGMGAMGLGGGGGGASVRNGRNGAGTRGGYM